MADLGNKVISSNYQKLLQISESKAVADGSGSVSALSLDIANSYVGVGTTSPSSTLNVVGTTTIAGTTHLSGSEYSSSQLVSISSSGGIIPVENDKYDLGSPTHKWRHLYLATGSLFMGTSSIGASNLEDIVKGTLSSNRDGAVKPGFIDAAQIRALTGGTILDSDTFIRFSTADEIKMQAGGEVLLTLTEGEALTGRDVVIVGDGGDVDFQVKTTGNTNTIYAVGSSGNVGIGTNTPQTELTVSGSISASGNMILENHKSFFQKDTSGNNQQVFRLNSANVLGIGDGDIETSLAGDGAVLTLSESRFGFGNTEPSETVTITGNISASGYLHLQGSGSNSVILSSSGDLTLNKLHAPKITLNDNSTNNKLIIQQEDALATFEFDDSAHQDVKFKSSADANHLRLDGGTGNTGIGAASPGEKLTVDGNISASGTIFADRLEVTEITSSMITSSTIVTSGSNIFGDEASDTHTFNGGIIAGHITASGNISASGTGSFTGGGIFGGNVGIGTTTPLKNLHIDGTNPDFIMRESDTEFFRIDVSADNINLGWDDTDDLHLGVYSSPTDTAINTKMIITQNGNVGIGLHPILGSPTHKLEVVGNISASGFIRAEGHITASGNISASGTITAEHFVSSDDAEITDDLIVGGDITASGNISASGRMFVTGNLDVDGTTTLGSNLQIGQYLSHNNDGDTFLNFETDKITLRAGGVDMITLTESGTDTIEFGAAISSHITASGNISSSGTITAEHFVSSDDAEITDDLIVGGDITASGNISASGYAWANYLVTSTDIFVTDAVKHRGDTNTKMTFGSDSITFTAGGVDMITLTEAGTNTAIELESAISSHITASGNISSSGTITAATLDAAAVSDGLAAAIVAEIDNDEIPIAKLAEDAVTVTAGTNLSNGGAVTLGGSITLNVDDAFLKNDADDTTSGVITAGGFTTTGHITASGNISASGNILTSGNITSLGTIIAEQITSTDDLSVSGQINAAADIVHTLDADTKISFATDKITLAAGGVDMITLTEAGTNTAIEFGAAISSHITASGNISASNTAGSHIFGGDTTLGTTQLTNITASGNISSSGTIIANSVDINGGTITGITDLAVADGGTGVSTLTDGGVLLGSGTSGITAMAVLTDGQMIVGDGTTDPVAESGATLRTSIGVGTTNNVLFNHITASGNISSSGTIIADNFTSTGGDTSGITISDDLNITGDITASGNISMSGDLFVDSSINSDGAILPITSNGAPLGSTSKMWSDLFLAEGGVINFDNGDVAVTQTGPKVAISGSGATVLQVEGDISASGGLTLGKISTTSDVASSAGNITSNNHSISHTLTLNANLADDAEHADVTITTDKCLATSVVVGCASAKVQVFTHTIAAGSFKFFFVNKSGGQINDDATIVFNFTII